MRLHPFISAVCLVSLISCGTTSTANFVLRGSTLKTETSTAGVVTSGSPKSLAVKIYKIYLGKNADCSDLQVVSDLTTNGEGYNLNANPLIMSYNFTTETYKCIAIDMDDLIIARLNQKAVDSWNGVCELDVDYLKDLYPASASGWKNTQGTSITSAGTNAKPVANRVTVFGSTDRASAIAGSLGLSTDQVFALSNQIEFPSKITFYIDYNEGINGSSQCTLTTGSMGFR